MTRPGLSICPAAVARAPVAKVWSLLVEPAAYTRWSDTAVESITPAGRAHAGQVIMLRTPRRGRWFRVRFIVESVEDVTHVIVLRAFFPLGLEVLSRIALTPVDGRSTRVQYG